MTRSVGLGGNEVMNSRGREEERGVVGEEEVQEGEEGEMYPLPSPLHLP